MGQEIPRIEYTLIDGTVVTQEPLRLGQQIEIMKQLKGEDLQGVLDGDRIETIMRIVLRSDGADVSKIDFKEQMLGDMALEVVQDFFILNPGMQKLLNGFSSVIRSLLLHAAAAGAPSTNGKDLNGSSTPSAPETSPDGDGS